MSSTFPGSSVLWIVPAAGKGTRISPVTKTRAKPGIAISFNPESGEVLRMIDVPLDAIRQAGGAALVTTHYAAETLAFINAYDNVTVVDDGGYITPLDSAVRNQPLVEDFQGFAVGILPADYEMQAGVLLAMQETLKATKADAVILGTRRLEGHIRVRPLDSRGFILPENYVSYESVADLGVHLFNKRWFLERLEECKKSGESIDIWKDFYRIDNPIAKVRIYVPESDRGWLDMGYPFWLRRTIYRLNAHLVDAYGNICFPGATILPGTTNTIALPSSTGLSVFHDAIIPEGTAARFGDDILRVHEQTESKQQLSALNKS